MPETSAYLERLDLNATSQIEAGNPDEVEEGEFAPSEFDVEPAGTFQSISPSVLCHSYENGRRYHKFRYGTYPIPNDDTEQNRDEMKHAITLELTDGKLYFAPIVEHPQRIIDLGTGTGTWAVEMADKFPSAQVIGLDLSPIQENWIPPNLRFIVEDLHDPWLHGNNFDFVHIRHVSPSMRDCESVFAKSFGCLKPGGWIEIQEFGGTAKCDDGSMRDDSPFATFLDKIDEAFSKGYGFQWRVANVLDEILAKSGFVNIGCTRFKAPIGRWPKSKKLRLVGEYMREVTLDLMDAIAVKPLREIMPPDDIAEILASAKEEIGGFNSHIYLDYFFWYAQKPVTSGSE